MEGDAGTSQLNPTGQETDAPEDPVAAVVAEQDEDTEPEAPTDDIAEGVVDSRRAGAPRPRVVRRNLCGAGALGGGRRRRRLPRPAVP